MAGETIEHVDPILIEKIKVLATLLNRGEYAILENNAPGVQAGFSAYLNQREIFRLTMKSNGAMHLLILNNYCSAIEEVQLKVRKDMEKLFLNIEAILVKGVKDETFVKAEIEKPGFGPNSFRLKVEVELPDKKKVKTFPPRLGIRNLFKFPNIKFLR